MKIAVVGFIKNEAAEILPWLGWYRELGVDTFIIYDDSSSDRTSDILMAATMEFDIRVCQVPFDPGPHPPRQRASYIDAIRSYGEEFDWIGFFDADEYLAIYETESLSHFLERPADVGAVAINWCNYGSGGHITRPNVFPFAAYLFHGTTTEPINRHIKSFIRPQCWSGNWLNVHYFNIGNYKYVDPAGQDVQWSETPGIISGNPDWSLGKIMHYQCRSMEHFVERSKKRKDIVLRADSWGRHDQNTIQDTRPLARVPAVKAHVCRANRGVIEAALRNMVVNLVDTVVTQVPKDIFEAENGVSFYKIRTHSSGWLSADAAGLAQAVDSEHIKQSIYALRFADRREALHLFCLNEHTPLSVNGDGRLIEFLTYIETDIPGQHGTALMHPTSQTYLSAEPTNLGGGVVCNRHFPKNWEIFVLHPVSADQIASGIFHSTLPSAILELQAPVTIEKVKALVLTLGLEQVGRLFPLVFYRLDDKGREKMDALLPVAIRSYTI